MAEPIPFNRSSAVEQGIPVDYTCAVVETDSGKFELVTRWQVKNKIDAYIKADFEPESEMEKHPEKFGLFSGNNHLIVQGKRIPTSDEFNDNVQFRRDIGAVVDNLFANSTLDNPVTLDLIQTTLSSLQYQVQRIIKE